MKQEKIIEHIKNIYSPSAIVLAGSRASGNYVEGSDWDFYVFTNNPHDEAADNFDGEVLDVSLVSVPVSANFTFDTQYHPEQHLISLHDTGALVTQPIERTILKYKNGPDEVSSEELARLKKILNRYIQKSLTRNTEGLSFYHLSLFYQMSLRVWFQVQKLWPLPPYEALPFIQAHDNEFYIYMKTISQNTNSASSVESAKKIYNVLFKIQ